MLHVKSGYASKQPILLQIYANLIIILFMLNFHRDSEPGLDIQVENMSIVNVK